MYTVPALMNEQHLEVVGKRGKDGFVCLKVHITNSNCAVTQETKLPLSIKLL